MHLRTSASTQAEMQSITGSLAAASSWRMPAGASAPVKERAERSEMLDKACL